MIEEKKQNPKGSAMEAVKQMVEIRHLMEQSKTPDQIKEIMGINKSQYFKRLRDMKALGVSWVVRKTVYNLITSGVFK